jgi:hypothetical protein
MRACFPNVFILLLTLSSYILSPAALAQPQFELENN